MKLKLCAVLLLIFTSIPMAIGGGAQNKPPTQSSPYDCGTGLTCVDVSGWSKGNHEIDCTVIRPWVTDEDTVGWAPYPVIAWANGWGQGNVQGSCVSEGYIPGLKEWALSGGRFIVVAANQWSAQESDVAACLEWVANNEPHTDGSKLGVSGHSQGGGAVIKAGDRKINGVEIAASAPMNPYGPSWVNPAKQGGPMLLLGGELDTTTPGSSFMEVWDEVKVGKGGVLAVRDFGTHNNDAWGSYPDGSTMSCADAGNENFGQYQYITELWWDITLRGNGASAVLLEAELANPQWTTFEKSIAPPPY